MIICQCNQTIFWGTEGQICIPHDPSPSLSTLFNLRYPFYPQSGPNDDFNLQKY
jgi:hypothetical protein